LGTGGDGGFDDEVPFPAGAVPVEPRPIGFFVVSETFPRRAMAVIMTTPAVRVMTQLFRFRAP
jgi:hypothetical protein